MVIRGVCCAALAAALLAIAPAASAQLSSYATGATDITGSTGAPAVALGVPDYRFVNDSGLGFGGTSTDVFDVGEAVELTFPTPLRNNPGQADLIVSAFVGGLGATDNATVQVEVSSDGVLFTNLGSFDTESARSFGLPLFFENNFEAVKHFFVEFGTADLVTHVRLTNLAGTAEGLRLDSVEGLHPVVVNDHAFEIRLERVREELAQRFRVRLKNIASPGGPAIREFVIDRSSDPGNSRLQETIWELPSANGEFICVENCIPDNHPTVIPFSRHVWSLDGTTEAPAGTGLDPGYQAANHRYNDFDTDGGLGYLVGYRFTITWTDGFSHTLSYDADVVKEIGSLYQQYSYFDETPSQTWNRPVDYYQFEAAATPQVPSLSAPAIGLLVLVGVGCGAWLLRRSPTAG